MLFVASSSWAQCDIPTATGTPTYPSVLIDEMTGQTLSSAATKCIVLVHGWNPYGVTDMYDINDGFEFYELIINLRAKLQGTGWSIVAYDWHQDASTGLVGPPTPSISQFVFGAANQAAANGQLHGDHLATMLDNVAPNLREVHFIAHSAGTHASKEAMIQLLQLNPYVIIQTTFLDPYIPCPSDSLGNFSDYAMNQLPFVTGNDRITRLENYFANDDPSHGWNAFPWGSWYPPTVDTQETFLWRTGIDINQEVDWGATLLNPVLLGSVFYSANYDWHAGPILFYSDTVAASIPGNTPSSSLPTESPYDYRQIGWSRSLYAWEAYLPQITIQPADQTVPSGGSVTLSMTVSGAINIDWYNYGGNWVGSGATLTLNNLTTANPDRYVARISNNNGQIYSRLVKITVGAAAAPTITIVSPTSLPTSSLAQTIKIFGTGFTGSSTLIFTHGASTFNSVAARLIYSSPNELDYGIIVENATGTWSVVVTNAGQVASNPQTFAVNTPPANTGSLVVNLSPAGIGAQWQINGTYYNSSEVVYPLTPGEYSVFFKPLSGYIAPATQTVTINANAQTTASAVYTVIAPITYALTLNQGGISGSIGPSPFGSVNGNADIYNAGSVVQLTADANSGYHFVNWSGDITGSVNPTTITMDGNKNVTANFAPGDPNMGTVIVTIQPPEAVAAGVTWGFNAIDDDFRASGTSYTTFPQTYLVYLWGTNSWTGGFVGTATITAGQTTNYTFVSSYTGGQIVGNDPRTYVTLAGSVTNPGVADGIGSSARFGEPCSPVVDTEGNIFIADSTFSTIRKITPQGSVSTFAGQAGVQGSTDGVGTNASFNIPFGLAIDLSNNLYVADTGNETIRKIAPDGSVSTLAGLAGNFGSADGTGGEALFGSPRGIAVGTNGNLYVADTSNETIRKVTPSGMVTTLAGLVDSSGTADGTGNEARFNFPSALAVDTNGNIYVADDQNSAIRKVTPSGVVTTFAGFTGSGGAEDGTGSAARFNNPSGIAIDVAGNIYVADNGNNVIREVTQAGAVTTLAGLSGNPGSADGIGSIVRFHFPNGVAVDASGDLFITDSQNNTIRATQPLTTPVDQTIAFAPLPNQSASDAPFRLTATASSGLPVHFSILSGPAVLDTNNVLTLLGAGVITVIAWQPGDSSYNTAVSVQQSFSVSTIPQTITFGGLSQQMAGDAPFSLNATASSGLAVKFSVSGPAVLSGNILVLTGGGTVTVTASQPGNDIYAPAANVMQSFVVTLPNNTLAGFGRQSNGGFQIVFYGLVGTNYTLQASTDLTRWDSLFDFICTSAPTYVVDPAATNYPQRFYRALLP